MSRSAIQPQSASFEQAMADAAILWWQMPAILFTGWYELATGTSRLVGCRRPSPHCDEHEQLTIPEPLEASGEDMLFA